MNSSFLSNRRYLVCFIEGNAICTHYPNLADILTDDQSEWKYAIQEDYFDNVLDLAIGERLRMQFNRHDRDDSDGYIKRIE